MIFSMFLVLEILCISFFLMSFFTRQLILWAITLVFAGVLMFTSFNVEYYTYVWNSTIDVYSPIMVSYSYPYLMGINILFFALSLALGLYDIFNTDIQKIRDP